MVKRTKSKWQLETREGLTHELIDENKVLREENFKLTQEMGARYRRTAYEHNRLREEIAELKVRLSYLIST